MDEVWNDCPICKTPLIKSIESVIICPSSIFITTSHYIVNFVYTNYVIERILTERYTIKKTMAGTTIQKLDRSTELCYLLNTYLSIEQCLELNENKIKGYKTFS